MRIGGLRGVTGASKTRYTVEWEKADPCKVIYGLLWDGHGHEYTVEFLFYRLLILDFRIPSFLIGWQATDVAVRIILPKE